jgi:hypothetical protein
VVDEELSFDDDDDEEGEEEVPEELSDEEDDPLDGALSEDAAAFRLSVR